LLFFLKQKKRKRNFAQRSLERFRGLPSGPWPETEQRRRRPASSQRRRSPKAREGRGNSTRRPRSTSRWARLELGAAGWGSPACSSGCGGGGQRRRRSGEPGRRQAGRGASLGRVEAVPEVGWSRERAEEGSPRSSGSGGGEWRRRWRSGRFGQPGSLHGAAGVGGDAVSGVGLDGGGLEKGDRWWSSGGGHGGGCGSRAREQGSVAALL